MSCEAGTSSSHKLALSIRKAYPWDPEVVLGGSGCLGSKIACLLTICPEAGADASSTTDDGSFPLLVAAEEGFEGVAELLIQHRADVSAKALDGFTVLHVAAQAGQEDMVRLLHTSGADLFTKANDGVTPMMSAAGNGRDSVVRLLLELGGGPAAERRWPHASSFRCDGRRGGDGAAAPRDGRLG